MRVREVVVVVQKGDHSLGYYDFETGAELDRVGIDPFPHEFCVSPDGRLAYSAHFGVALAEDEGAGGNSVSIVDLAARRRIGTIDCGEYRRPHDVTLDAKGRLYALSEGTGHLLRVSDPAGGVVDRVLPTGGVGSHMVSVKADGSVAFVSNMNSDTVAALFPDDPERPPVIIPVVSRPEGSVFDAQERRLYVMNREACEISVLDVAALRLVASIPVPKGPVRVRRTPEGLLLIALYHDCGLAIVDPAAGRCRVVPLPEKPISVGYHVSSRRALLSTHAHRMWVVDPVAGKPERFIATRRDPDPMVVLPLEI
jgi:YVTN family beta-propeller protein